MITSTLFQIITHLQAEDDSFKRLLAGPTKRAVEGALEYELTHPKYVGTIGGSYFSIASAENHPIGIYLDENGIGIARAYPAPEGKKGFRVDYDFAFKKLVALHFSYDQKRGDKYIGICTKTGYTRVDISDSVLFENPGEEYIDALNTIFNKIRGITCQQ